MTFKKLVIGLSMILLLANCSIVKVNILGIDVNQTVTSIKAKNIGKMALGTIASVATHVAGHYIIGELVGADIRQQGMKEIILNPQYLSNNDKQWFARGGFIAQALVNTCLTFNENTRKSFFTRGYTLTTFAQVATYPLRYDNYGDLDYIKRGGGNPNIEWALFSAIGGYNFYRINKEDD